MNKIVDQSYVNHLFRNKVLRVKDFKSEDYLPMEASLNVLTLFMHIEICLFPLNFFKGKLHVLSVYIFFRKIRHFILQNPVKHLRWSFFAETF